MGPRNFTRTIKIDTQIYFILLNFVFTTPHLDMKKIVVIVFTLFIIGIFGQEYPSLQRWNELALSVPRSNIAAASAKNYAILSGGLYENGTASDVVDVLDVSTRNISRLTLPSPRYNILATAAGRYVIFAGGFEVLEVNETSSVVNVWSKAIDILDVDSMLWKTAEFPDSFDVTESTVVTSTGSTAVFFNGQMFATYDPAANDSSWTTTALSPGSRVTPDAVTSIGSVVYVSANLLDRVFGFNSSSSTLIPDPALLPAVNVVGGIKSALAIGDKVYFASGNTLFIYERLDNIWSITLFPFTSSQGAVAVQGNVFTYKTDAQGLLFVETSTWIPHDFVISINATGVTVVEDKYIVLAGGYDNGKVTAALHVLEYIPAAVPVATSEPQAPVASIGTKTASISFIMTLSALAFT
jgi:hypothetical protein